MKKLFLSLIVLFLLASCEENVKFNNPSLQGLKDNVFWRVVDSKATLASDGSLQIEGYTTNEKLFLKTTSTAPQTYFLGTSESKKASYELLGSGGSIIFSTGFGIGDGQIVIIEYDALNMTVSGTFKFNAENIANNPLAGPSINFQQGVFYKVPVVPAQE